MFYLELFNIKYIFTAPSTTNSLSNLDSNATNCPISGMHKILPTTIQKSIATSQPEIRHRPLTWQTKIGHQSETFLCNKERWDKMMYFIFVACSLPKKVCLYLRCKAKKIIGINYFTHVQNIAERKWMP